MSLIGSQATGLGSVPTAGGDEPAPGGSGGTDPDAGGNADLILWLDAQAAGIVTDAFNKISLVPDQSQYGNDADQTETSGHPRPATLNPAGINGLPSITVDNDENKAIGRNNIPAPRWLTTTGNYTAIIACKSDGPNGPLPFIPGFDGISIPRISFGAYTPSPGVQDVVASTTGGFTAVPYTDTPVDYAGIPIILTVVCFAGVVTVRINGSERPIAVFDGATAVAFSSYILGMAGADGTLTEVGEVRFYKVPLNDTLLEEREGFLSAKWRIPLQPVPPPFVESVSATDASAINNADPQNPVALQATAARGGTLRKEDFAKLADVPDGAFPLVALLTDVLDFTQPQTFTFPAHPGYAFVPVLNKVFQRTAAGAIATAFTWKAGNDATNTNAAPSQTPPTTAFSTNSPASAAFSSIPATPFQIPDLSTPISVVITGGATGTGGFAWTGRLCFCGFMVPL